VALGYTPDGLLASLTDAASHATDYAYDGFDRLSTATYPDSSAESLSYDANGNVLTRKTRKGDTLTFTYDTLNRLSTKAAPSEATVSWGYDLGGRVTSVGDTSAAVTAPSTTATYTVGTTYDAMNRPNAVTWGPAAAQTTPAASAASFTYGYDPTNRRVSQSATDNSWWSYPTAASAISYTPNNLNQYSAVGAVTQTYDGNGNLTHDGGYLYGFDAESRLTGISSLATAGNCDSTLLTMT
jgi:YD repeat-containing protein